MEEESGGSICTTKKRTVQLKCIDGEIFEVEEVVVLQFQILKDFIAMDAQKGNDDCHVPCGALIPLPQVSSKILAKVIEYCKYHFDSQQRTQGKQVSSEEEIQAWDVNIVKANLEILYNILLASNYLDITNLMALTSESAYNLEANGRTLAEVCKTFHMREDLISMESKQIESGEDTWAFDKFDE